MAFSSDIELRTVSPLSTHQGGLEGPRTALKGFTSSSYSPPSTGIGDSDNEINKPEILLDEDDVRGQTEIEDPTESNSRLRNHDTDYKTGNHRRKLRYLAYRADGKSLLWDWWLWEIAGIVLSLLVTIAIIVILAKYNGQPLPDWPYSITLNAMISILSTLAKSSMLLAATQCVSQAKWLHFGDHPQRLIDFYDIDEASRGPYGALILLARKGGNQADRKGGRPILAAVGAFVILASLAVDPFTQQVLSYPLRSRRLMEEYHEITAFVPIRQSWIHIDGPESDAWPSDNYYDDLFMKSSIYDSLFSLGVSQPSLKNDAQPNSMFECSTGNCTFESLRTLGFCSTCGPITASVEQTCNETCVDTTDSGNRSGILLSKDECSNPSSDTPVTIPDGKSYQYTINCTYQISQNISSNSESKPNLTLGWNFETLPHGSWTNTDGSNMSTIGSFNTEVLSFLDIPYPAFVFARAFVEADVPSFPPPTGSITTPNITGCAIYMCVQSMDTNIQNGVINQGVWSTWRNETNWWDEKHVSEIHPSPASSNSTLVAGQNSTFSFDFESQQNLFESLGDTLTTAVIYEGGENSFSSDFAKALWLVDQDLDKMMENLANRMTDALRSASTDDRFQGSPNTLQVHVSVRWAWLVLPVTLVLISCALLLASIISSSKNHTALWKSNSLAPVFHGLGNPDGRILGLERTKQMNDAAEGVHVQLKRNEDDHLYLLKSQ